MIDPYAIESTLASATLNPTTQAAALPLLGMYQAQRATNSSNYNDQLKIQQALAQQRIGGENIEKYATALKNLGETPGGLSMITPNSVFAQLGIGQDPSVLSGAAGLATSRYMGGTLKDVGAGAYDLARAGLPIPASSAAAVTGMGNYAAEPLSTTDERIRAGATVEAALAPSKPSAQIEANLPGGDKFVGKGAPGDAATLQAEAQRLRQGGGGGPTPGNRGPVGLGNTLKPGPAAAQPDVPGPVTTRATDIMAQLGASTKPEDKAMYKAIMANAGAGGPKIVQTPDGGYSFVGQTEKGPAYFSITGRPAAK
jgi:hypothetical protein